MVKPAPLTKSFIATIDGDRIQISTAQGFKLIRGEIDENTAAALRELADQCDAIAGAEHQEGFEFGEVSG